MTTPARERLWYWVRERELIRERRARGEHPPWTEDPILATYRFCNVRREDDTVTVWIRKHVREPYAGHSLLWLMLCICRQINWLDTLSELIDVGAWPNRNGFLPSHITTALANRKDRGDKIYTGAYVIAAPQEKGSDKQAHVAEVVIGGLWRRRDEFSDWTGKTLQGTHEKIARSHGWGNFMTYQAVVDMRFTGLLDTAEDRHPWAAAGPGTIRGLNRIHSRPVDASLTQRAALLEMRELHAENPTGVAMDFSDVPNILCETDKYLRVAYGEGKPRARYVAGRGA